MDRVRSCARAAVGPRRREDPLVTTRRAFGPSGPPRSAAARMPNSRLAGLRPGLLRRGGRARAAPFPARHGDRNQAGPNLCDRGRHGDRADDPRPHPRRVPRPRDRRRGIRHRGWRRAVRWYIDPIDGTHNFMRGIPLFGTLLGVEVDGELQVGVMCAPALGGRWFARRGGGAWARSRGEAAAADPRLERDDPGRRPPALRIAPGDRGDRRGPGVRGPDRRRLARSRLRRLLGLRAGG